MTDSFPSAWLAPRRIRRHAIILAVCLWGVCALDFSTPGLFDRAGNIKFQDFLQFYISARLIAEGRASQLFDQQVADAELHDLVRQPTRVRLPTVYGPQVGLLFVPLTRFSFPVAARIWVAKSLLLFFLCVFLVWRFCPNLRAYPTPVVLLAIAFPPLFHCFVRGQLSMLLVACFTVAFFAFRAGHDWLAGLALGLLVFKPQFLVAIPLILLASQAWKAFTGLVASAAAQLALTWAYFGTPVMRAYLSTMYHASRWISLAELASAHVQMHSLRSFWFLLIPWPRVVLALYVLSSIAVVLIATVSWRSAGDLRLRFSALVVAAVLVNPHLFVYDLLVLALVFLLLADWVLANPANAAVRPLRTLLYLAFLLPLFGPLALWTHVQFSVLAFAALQWTLWRTLSRCDSIPE